MENFYQSDIMNLLIQTKYLQKMEINKQKYKNLYIVSL